MLRALVVTATILGAMGAGAANADPVKLRIGWSDVPSSITPIMDQKPELAPHLGKTYTIDPIHFAGTAPMITALATNDLDVGEMAFGSFGIAIQNAHMNDVRVIADEMQDGVPGYLSIPYVVMKNGPIKTIADLKGKVIATNVLGSGTDIGQRAYLRKNGLEDKRDYSELEVAYFSMKDMMKQGKVDLITTIHSTALDPEMQAITRPLFYLRDGMGVTAILFRVARAPFIARNRAALVDYFEDEARQLRWYMDPKNHAAAVAVSAKFNKQPPAHYDSWLYTKADIYRDPDNMPNLVALQSNLKTQKEAGFLNIDIDVSKFADTSLVEEAAKRLK